MAEGAAAAVVAVAVTAVAVTAVVVLLRRELVTASSEGTIGSLAPTDRRRVEQGARCLGSLVSVGVTRCVNRSQC
jgi:hypothetical protein